jgi:hypothetical protein
MTPDPKATSELRSRPLVLAAICARELLSTHDQDLHEMGQNDAEIWQRRLDRTEQFMQWFVARLPNPDAELTVQRHREILSESFPPPPLPQPKGAAK